MLKKFLVLFLFFGIASCSSDDGDEMGESQNNPPIFSQLVISGISETTAQLSTNIENTDEVVISESGFVYGTDTSPEFDAATTIRLGTPSGEIVTPLSNLQPSNTYYARAFAVKEGEVYYGVTMVFETLVACANVFSGDISLSTQQELNTFGANGYCKVTGVLSIETGSFEDLITDLGPLSSLVSVGSLKIYSSEELYTLSGLENLNSIEDDLFIQNSRNLLNVDAFINLKSVSKLFIQRCGKLENLDGLLGITSINNKNTFALQIMNCDTLENIDGLSNLTEIFGSIDIYGNENLQSIAALSNITNLEFGGISIGANPLLTNLTGLHNITSIAENIEIDQNDQLTDITALSNMTTMGKYLSIQNNNMLTSLQGLESLQLNATTVFRIENNNALISIDALQNVEVLEQLEIEFNASLASLNGLSNLTTINVLKISENNALSSLQGLSSLTTVTNRIVIDDNNSLVSLDGLEEMSSERINCFDNSALSDFCSVSQGILTGSIENFSFSGNAYNPTQQDIIDGNCSQ